MYSYAIKKDNSIVWLKGKDVVKDPYVDPYGNTYVIRWHEDVTLKFVSVEDVVDVVYRKSDGIILQSPIDAMVGTVWKLQNHDWIHMKALKGMHKYPDGYPIYLDGGEITIWVQNGWPVWVDTCDDKDYFFKRGQLPPKHKLYILLLLNMHEDQLKVLRHVPDLGTHDRSYLRTDPITWDDEEVHALRFKKGSPYILQGTSMDAKVLSIISAPGYPTVIKSKMPIIMDMDDDGSWRTSIPILYPSRVNIVSGNKYVYSGAGEGHSTIAVMDAYIPMTTPRPTIISK